MAKYTVKVARAPKGHEIPPLLSDVGAFVAKQTHGALGWFDSFAAAAIPKEWNPEKAARLQKAGFTFLELPEGSLLALLEGAVVLLGSEGEARTVANSLEEFLLVWSKGETEIDELDDEDGVAGRRALAAWLKEKKVKAPKKKDFDFLTWLEGAPAAAPAPAPAPAKAAKREVTPTMKELGPKARALASLMGRLADDPEVIAYVTKTLGKKVPASTNERNDSVNVSAPKAGIELVFSHDVQNVDYPPVVKSGKTFVPYLTHAWIHEKLGEPVLGVAWNSTLEDVTKKLGKPTRMRKLTVLDKTPTISCWTKDLGGGVELDLEFRKQLGVEMSVATASYLEQFVDPSTFVFLGWAITRGLVDEALFADRADLFKAVKAKKAKASELGLLRGLWDAHLKDLPELRATAYLWFHNMKNMWITKDLKAVFGKREGKHGHDEPKLDDDSWPNVDKAAKAFEKQFAAWLK